MKKLTLALGLCALIAAPAFANEGAAHHDAPAATTEATPKKPRAKKKAAAAAAQTEVKAEKEGHETHEGKAHH